MASTNAKRDDARLRRLEAVTDATLSRLTTAELLDTLPGRIREVLDADTAVILLLDVQAQQLVATAANGLEEEVEQGFRVAVGRGFAGRVAYTRRPVIVAGQIHSRKPDDAAAVALHQSLLPVRLPAIEGMDAAARYRPSDATGIGGDWYNLFTLPSGWLGVVMGDVSGHGLASAVVMGRIRSALRAYTLLSHDPAHVLTLLDRKVRHFEAGNLSTALYAMIPPDRDTVWLSSAGHVLPVLAVPGEPAALVDMPVDPPLGVLRADAVRRTTRFVLPPGALMVCYTDGLVERRGQSIDAGLEMLTAGVRAEDPETVCATAMSSLAGERSRDDVAILALRRRPALAG